jgi:hypothetical protein
VIWVSSYWSLLILILSNEFAFGDIVKRILSLLGLQYVSHGLFLVL